MKENMNKNSFTVDQRLRAIKDTVDKMCWDHYNHPKTVLKTAEQFLAEETNLMEHILKEVTDIHKSMEEMSVLLLNTSQFCNDLEVEIKKGYDMFGLDIPTAEELLGESEGDNEDTEKIETSRVESDLEEGCNENVDKNDSDSMRGLTFCEPTPAKPKNSSKKLVF